MKKPKISIIVTTFNLEKFVSQSVQSIILQSISDIEIIIVDDGSQDGTVEILKDFEQTDPRIKLLILGKTSIGGVATAANAGMNIATGEYIGFADGDDLYDSSAFEKLYNAASLFGADIAICDYCDLDNETGVLSNASDQNIWHLLPKEMFFYPTKEDVASLLRMSPVPWRKLYKREFIEQNRIRFLEVDYFFEDNPFHWSVITKCKSVALVRESLCFHRLNRPNQTMAAGSTKIINVFNHFEAIKQIAETNGEYELDANLICWLVAHIWWAVGNVHSENHYEIIRVVRPYLKKYSKNQIKLAHSQRIISSVDVGLIILVLASNTKSLARTIKKGRLPKILKVRKQIYLLGLKRFLRLKIKQFFKARNEIGKLKINLIELSEEQDYFSKKHDLYQFINKL